MTRAVVNRGQSGGGVLARLVRDVRAAALAWMCIAIIPFCGMVGGGVDIARMYIAKTRLQHACDAGALAGRKQMGSGTWGSDDLTAANRFFNANYRTGAYGTNALTREFTENAGKVTGSASATVPMTLMRVLGRKQETLSVSCDAEMRLPNTDIMFVLDNTGSMNERPSGDTQTKLQSLKVAVKCFYEIVARLDTDANCTTGTPSGGTGNQVQIRFGFVPYATNVNVGGLLKPEWLADTWPYQSRRGRWWDIDPSKAKAKTTKISVDGVPSLMCNDSTATLYKYNKFTESVSTTSYQWYPTGTKRTTHSEQLSNYTWNFNNGKSTCSTDQTVTDNEFTLTELEDPAAGDEWWDWRYSQFFQRVSALKNGSSFNTGLSAWIGNNGTKKPMNWDGCVEERATVKQASYSPIPAGARDLDLDSVPTAGDAGSLWGPLLPGMIYTRRDDAGNFTMSDRYNRDTPKDGSVYGCPLAAKKLQSWPDAGLFGGYVDSMTAGPNTYHDIGLSWGGRLMSAGDNNGNGGLFASENKYTPQGGEIDRHMIFMTDGDTCTDSSNYQAYGIAWYDRRQTDSGTVPSEGCTNNGVLTQQVNARTTAVCNAIKNKNITLWVITFGYVDPTTVTRLTACATSGRYYSANNAAEIQATFASIANQISQLRLTQ
ncbi:TadE/TadG family type IV pilus assembly protein [Sphingomonas aerophila]|uniref:TadE/TadG family type IV pilus assembly protein n=1 Tax=Sphingomonas aerophila TaxID=1344948 RepID=UPI001C841456|nr:TadE/TadG family type IV pilus assembly protein [Sphingomonas aerophila]